MVPIMESDGLFWGLTLVTGKLYNQTPSTGFHVSMAALAPDDGPKKPVTIFVKYNGSEFALCTLCPGSVYQQALDLNFAAGEEVTFFIKGNKVTVDLTGYILPEEDFDESQLSDDDDLSEQDMNEEEGDVSEDEDNVSMDEEDSGDDEAVKEIILTKKKILNKAKKNEGDESAITKDKKVVKGKKSQNDSKTNVSVDDSQVNLSEKESENIIKVSDIVIEKDISVEKDENVPIPESTKVNDTENSEKPEFIKNEAEVNVIKEPSELSKPDSEDVPSENTSINIQENDSVLTDNVDKLKKKKKKKNKNKSANNSMEESANETLNTTVEDDQVNNKVDISEKELTKSVEVSDIVCEKDISEDIEQKDIDNNESEIISETTLAKDNVNSEKPEIIIESEDAPPTDTISEKKNEADDDIFKQPSELSKPDSEDVPSENTSINVQGDDPDKVDNVDKLKKKKKKNKNKSANNSMESNETVESLDMKDDTISEKKNEADDDSFKQPSELSKPDSEDVPSENTSINIQGDDPDNVDKLKKKKKNKNKSANNSMESNETLNISVESLDMEEDKDESISNELSPQSMKRKLDESETGETENKKKKKKKNKKKQKMDESLNSSVASDAGNTTTESPVPAKTENKKKTNDLPKRVLQGGIIMQDLKEGHGPVANSGKMVHVYYKGTLKNGKEFDSCLSGKPFKFRLGKQEVIKGWDVGLSGMKVGGKRKLVVPAAQAYGNKNLGDIPANSTLMFDVELKAVN